MAPTKNKSGRPISTGKKQGKIGSFLERRQRHWALWLSGKAGKVSLAKQKMVLVVFVLLASVFLLLQMVGGSAGGLPKSGSITKAKLPQTNQPEHNGILSELARIESMKKYLDSLWYSEGGRKELDSLLHKHPGLRDSLEIWEYRLRNFGKLQE